MSQRYDSEQWIAVPLETVFRFFADPRNLPALMPPSRGTRLEKVVLVPPSLPPDVRPPGYEQMAGIGSEIIMAFRVFPYIAIHDRWVARITEFSLNEYFRDVQMQGPFRQWRHMHSFQPKVVDQREGTLIRDEIEYEVGFGIVGQMLEIALFQPMVRSTFEYRKLALEKALPSR